MATASASKSLGEIESRAAPGSSRAAPPDEGLRMAQGLYLDELPGVAFGLITVGWIVMSLAQLM